MSKKPKCDNIHHVVFLGSSGVGKSAITLQFMYDEFVEDYEPTKSDYYSKNLILDGQEVQIDIFDYTPCEEDYGITTDYAYRSSEGFILVFSVTSEQSFSDIVEFHSRILHARDSENIPIILVGNKCDLTDERAVDRKEAENCAYHWKIPYLETSAKTRENIDKVFYDLIRIIKESKTKICCCSLL